MLRKMALSAIGSVALALLAGSCGNLGALSSAGKSQSASARMMVVVIDEIGLDSEELRAAAAAGLGITNCGERQFDDTDRPFPARPLGICGPDSHIFGEPCRKDADCGVVGTCEGLPVYCIDCSSCDLACESPDLRLACEVCTQMCDESKSRRNYRGTRIR